MTQLMRSQGDARAGILANRVEPTRQVQNTLRKRPIGPQGEQELTIKAIDKRTMESAKIVEIAT